ncbi:hypothetical protein LEMLEM_LOCUS6973, partial [Lemmus lemmus]
RVPRASGPCARVGDRHGKLQRCGSGRQLRNRRGRGRRCQEPTGEATVLLHRAHHHGHPAESEEAPDAQRDLRVHQRPVPVLPGEVPRLAEQHPPQPVAQRLLRQDSARTGQPGQGQLLDARPGVRRHVRQRQLPAAPQALQAPAAAPPARGGRGAAAARRGAGGWRGGSGRRAFPSAAASRLRLRSLRLRLRPAAAALRAALRALRRRCRRSRRLPPALAAAAAARCGRRAGEDRLRLPAARARRRPARPVAGGRSEGGRPWWRWGAGTLAFLHREPHWAQPGSCGRQCASLARGR